MLCFWAFWLNNFTSVSSWSCSNFILFDYVVICILLVHILFNKFWVLATTRIGTVKLLKIVQIKLVLGGRLIVFIFQLLKLGLDNVYVRKLLYIWIRISSILCHSRRDILIIIHNQFFIWLVNIWVLNRLLSVIIIHAWSLSSRSKKLACLREILILDTKLLLELILVVWEVLFVHFLI